MMDRVNCMSHGFRKSEEFFYPTPGGPVLLFPLFHIAARQTGVFE